MMCFNNSREKKIAILISGRGTNMAALIDAQQKAIDCLAQITVVISNKNDAPGLFIAQDKGITTETVSSNDYAQRALFDRALHDVLLRYEIDIVCLAGFMRILTPWFVEQWLGRMINIHPSLLPLFTGTHTHECVLEAGHTQHGCTVHFVTPELDAGPIIAQIHVPVLSTDTPETLAARVLVEENKLYPQALEALILGKVQYQNGKTVFN